MVCVTTKIKDKSLQNIYYCRFLTYSSLNDDWRCELYGIVMLYGGKEYKGELTTSVSLLKLKAPFARLYRNVSTPI
jgi:hypothetical protein